MQITFRFISFHLFPFYKFNCNVWNGSKRKAKINNNRYWSITLNSVWIMCFVCVSVSDRNFVGGCKAFQFFFMCVKTIRVARSKFPMNDFVYLPDLHLNIVYVKQFCWWFLCSNSPRLSKCSLFFVFLKITQQTDYRFTWCLIDEWFKLFIELKSHPMKR